MIDVLLGLQWGDEGKGKIVDLVSGGYDVVARFGGGCNAGHTLVFNGKKHVLHLIPSGIFHDCINVIGNGVVIDPVNIMGEISKLEEMGIDVKSKLFISDKAHITLPWHKDIDKQLEDKKGHKKIGSTLKGIGPTYTSKTSREGFRIGDISHLNDYFLAKSLQNKALDNNYDWKTLEYLEFVKALTALIKYNVINTEVYLNNVLSMNKKILAEGAQGTQLDIDFGSYPFVTSSSTCIGGVMTGLGVPPQSIKNVIGITKAYCTRVGSGPFPTEQENEIGEKIRQIGKEFGSTTGRPRRCGWIDLATLKYSCMINGVTELCLMKLDVLTGLDEIKACIDYKGNEPVYSVSPGWSEDISEIKNFENLPENCKNYVNFVQDYLKIKVTKISVGSDREQTIVIN